MADQETLDQVKLLVELRKEIFEAWIKARVDLLNAVGEFNLTMAKSAEKRATAQAQNIRNNFAIFKMRAFVKEYYRLDDERESAKEYEEWHAKKRLRALSLLKGGAIRNSEKAYFAFDALEYYAERSQALAFIAKQLEPTREELLPENYLPANEDERDDWNQDRKKAKLPIGEAANAFEWIDLIQSQKLVIRTNKPAFRLIDELIRAVDAVILLEIRSLKEKKERIDSKLEDWWNMSLDEQTNELKAAEPIKPELVIKSDRRSFIDVEERVLLAAIEHLRRNPDLKNFEENAESSYP